MNKTSDIVSHILDDMLYELRRDSSSHLYISIGYKIGWKYIYVYTDKPGYLIGLRGKNVYKMEDQLREKGINKKIYFIEIGSYYPREITFTNNPFVKLYRKIKKLLRKE